MQIALTSKLAKAMELKIDAADEQVHPLFCWTANWTKVWDNRRAEDLLVLVNEATRFTVAIYQLKRAKLKNVEEIILEAIQNTMYAMNFNREMVGAYIEMAGNLSFVRNSNRKAAAWISHAGRDCSFHIGNTYNGIEKMYSDTVGVFANRMVVNTSGNNTSGFYPYKAMSTALEELTGKTTYQYKAYELLITLDLDIYQAKRKIIVPAHIPLEKFHLVLQKVFNWKNYHLYDFAVFHKEEERNLARLVPYEEDLAYDDEAILINKQVLSDYLSDVTEMIYTYDMGDYWQHHIELLNVIENFDEESPYLVEASGQTPPEDVGGISGYKEFYNIILNKEHPRYDAMKEWASFWSVELGEWDKRPKVISVY